MTIDLKRDAEAQIGSLKEVTEVASRMLHLQADIADLESKLSDKKNQLGLIENQELPDIMTSCRLKKFSMSDGSEISLKQIVRAGLPSQTAISKEKDEFQKSILEKRLADGLDWLRKSGGEPLIKNTVELEFSKGQDNLAGDFVGQAEEKGIPYSRKTSVHPSTLSNFVKERIQKGLEVPMEDLSVYCGQKAVVKTPR